jgi:hypothetical protein
MRDSTMQNFDALCLNLPAESCVSVASLPLVVRLATINLQLGSSSPKFDFI